MRKTLILILLTTIISTASAQPFVPDGSITANAMPQSIWPHQPPIRTPPLARPAETANGFLTAFWTPNLSQNNPNSPMPATSPQCAKWVWSDRDRTGWQCTAKPAQTPTQPTPQPPATATCTIWTQTFYCSWAGKEWPAGGANGQLICLTGGNNAVIPTTGQPITCTAYN